MALLKPSLFGCLEFDGQRRGYTAIPNIPDDTTEVDLSLNSLNELPADVFANLRNCVDDNDLSVIDVNAFRGTLNLRRNRITQLQNDVFSTGKLH